MQALIRYDSYCNSACALVFHYNYVIMCTTHTSRTLQFVTNQTHKDDKAIRVAISPQQSLADLQIPWTKIRILRR